MPAAYRQKIISTFRDNAVRSVLLIDDDYLPYEKLADSYPTLLSAIKTSIQSAKNDAEEILGDKLMSLQDIVDSANTNFMASDVARDFVDFFHKKKLICDVESQTDNLEKEKIRKSDLIILDYHLQKMVHNPAERALDLICDLSSSKHMNLVVVYTAEELKNVWREIAVALRGSHVEDISPQTIKTAWDLNEEDWVDDFNRILDQVTESKYIKNEHNLDSILELLQTECGDLDHEIPDKRHLEWLLESHVNSLNKNNKPISNLVVNGTVGLWLQAGDVFVVLCEKKRAVEGEEFSHFVTPNEVWDQIRIALEDWYPSFYRVVISELQNQIEDANFSMNKELSKDAIEQIAALWGVLRVDNSMRENTAQELLDSLLNDIVDKIQSRSELLTFIKDVANCIDDNLPPFVSKEENKDKYNNYLKDIVTLAKKNLVRNDANIDPEFRASVLHAFNEQLCIEKKLPNHISTGVILKDINTSSYYLCITPSCNTVPNQLSGEVAKRMTPHRPMRFIKLVDNTKNLLKCLKDAHESNTIFISDNRQRLALNIFEQGDTPIIEQGVVINHDSQLIDDGSHKIVQFLDIEKETKKLLIIDKELKPIAKLRAGFASRYQNVQLQYEARIGVDLVSGNMK
ncbi:response regulator receiver domain [Aeromonas salmonicida]|uniref:response regulator receiver domain n=1 Tax=Aeromonas salmonicida TaxID=645 RepID=UPI003D31ABE3